MTCVQTFLRFDNSLKVSFNMNFNYFRKKMFCNPHKLFFLKTQSLNFWAIFKQTLKTGWKKYLRNFATKK